MTDESSKKMTECIERINAMSDDEFEALISEDKCPYEPEHLVDEPLGMFHCPCCGEMVLAGFPHPRQTDPDILEEELERLAMREDISEDFDIFEDSGL